MARWLQIGVPTVGVRGVRFFAAHAQYVRFEIQDRGYGILLFCTSCRRKTWMLHLNLLLACDELSADNVAEDAAF
jgi:hypothetical protein